MKKLILVLVALIGLVGSASADTIHLYDSKYLVSNEQIGTIEYTCGSIDRFPGAYKILTNECNKKCVWFIKDNKGLNAEVKALTKHYGLTAAALSDGTFIINTYDGENFSFYQFR